MKLCRLCKLEKEPAEFYKDPSKKGGIRKRCKSCDNLQKAKWKVQHPETIHSERIRREYGLSKEDYLAMLKIQDYKCKICKTANFVGQGNRPQVDHCHVTNKVRGLLCCHCNRGLGGFKDNIESLKVAIKYLENTNMPD